jgi:hypothetical protein
MIPAPPRISAPPRREASPGAHRPQLAPRLTTQTSPTLPPRHKRFPHGSTAVPAQPPPTASSPPCPPPVPARPQLPPPARRRFPAPGRPARRRAFPPPPFRPRLSAPAFPPAPVSGPGPRPPARRRAFRPRPLPPLPLSYARRLSHAIDCTCAPRRTILTSAPSHHTSTGYLPFEQFNECGVLPDRSDRVPHSLKVSSRGGVAAEVGGGREDGAAGGTGQGEQTGTGSGSRLVLAGGVARHRVKDAAGWVGRRL